MNPESAAAAPRSFVFRLLDLVERVGNRLPDPAILFLLLMGVVALCSAFLSGFAYAELDPRSGQPIVVHNLLSGPALTAFTAGMVNTFVTFHPLGVVLVAMLGLGVAEHTGFISALLRRMLSITPRALLTPALVAVGIFSHVAVDAGYVLVIPLGAVIFYAAGRHPLAGVSAAFAGVSGGFSATLFVPSSLDPLLSGLSQVAGRLIDPAVVVNPLNNFFFTTASSLLIVLIGWVITDRVIEPRLRATAVDGDPAQMPKLDPLTEPERRGLLAAFAAIAVSTALFAATLMVEGTPWAAPAAQVAAGQHPLLVGAAPLMQSIVPLIFLFFLIPGIVYGVFAGSVKSHRDVVAGMSKAMSGMGYYIVMAFFCALFIATFAQSNIGVLLAIKGANALKAMGLPVAVTLVGVVLLTASVNLLIGSSSAKWALIGAILVPMMMQLGISPDLTQAAYRVGDSSTNIITPLMPYFPLVVVFCQRYVKSSGIGTLLALMLPYSLSFLVCWTLFLLAFYGLGLPLGVGASYIYAPPQP